MSKLKDFIIDFSVFIPILGFVLLMAFVVYVFSLLHSVVESQKKAMNSCTKSGQEYHECYRLIIKKCKEK